VTARSLVEGRDPDETMHPGLGGHQPERVLAVECDRSAFDPRFFARLIVQHFALEPAALCPFQVHLEQHFRPVLRFGAAGAGMNGDDGVGAVVLTTQHLLDLGGLDLVLQGVERTLEIGSDVFAALGPFEKNAEIVELSDERVAQLDLFAQAAATLEGLLSFGLVGPEIGSGDALLDRGEFTCGVGGVKDSSGGLWRV
jgi:hypothetical protein